MFDFMVETSLLSNRLEHYKLLVEFLPYRSVLVAKTNAMFSLLDLMAVYDGTLGFD